MKPSLWLSLGEGVSCLVKIVKKQIISTERLTFQKLSNAIAYAVVEPLTDKAYRMFEYANSIYCMMEGNEIQNPPTKLEVEVLEQHEIDEMTFVKFKFEEKELWIQV